MTEADQRQTADVQTETKPTLYGPQVDVNVYKNEAGDYVAVEYAGIEARSGNPYVALANLVDKLAGEEIEIDVTIKAGGRDE